MQPALQMASKILQCDHPYWRAITNVYHLRPVPGEKDGRTQAEKADPRYRPYVSFWYEIDRSKMYPAARDLMERNFDAAAAGMEMIRRRV